MDTNINLLLHLPHILRDIREFEVLSDIISEELNTLNKCKNNLLRQCFVDTATWGLNYWEQILGIQIDESKPIEFRRSRIISKIRGKGTSTVQVIKSVAESFTNREAEVIEDNSDSKFEIKIAEDSPINLKDLYNAVDEIKPAHLEYGLLISSTPIYSNVASQIICGEYIAVYPWMVSEIKSIGYINIAIGNDTSAENIKVYPKGR